MSFLRLQEREMLLTGGKDGKIRLWDIETAEMERVMTANMGAIMEMVII
jgi:WD40 repeat protein